MFSALSEYPESPERGVRIWSANLERVSAAEREELAATLDATERTRAARFHFEMDRQRYVIARGLLRFLLGAELKEEPFKLVLGEGAKGKPFLVRAGGDAASGLRFNLSHSESAAIFVLAWEREVGIDLEASARLGPGKDLNGLAERIFSANELQQWRTLPNDAARHAAFLRGWTRKEAYVKATGQGIFDRVAEIELILDAHKPQPSLAINQWMVHDLRAPEGFAAAVVIENERR